MKARGALGQGEGEGEGDGDGDGDGDSALPFPLILPLFRHFCCCDSCCCCCCSYCSSSPSLLPPPSSLFGRLACWSSFQLADCFPRPGLDGPVNIEDAFSPQTTRPTRRLLG